jgi:hypothetical protein
MSWVHFCRQSDSLDRSASEEQLWNLLQCRNRQHQSTQSLRSSYIAKLQPRLYCFEYFKVLIPSRESTFLCLRV